VQSALSAVDSGCDFRARSLAVLRLNPKTHSVSAQVAYFAGSDIRATRELCLADPARTAASSASAFRRAQVEWSDRRALRAESKAAPAFPDCLGLVQAEWLAARGDSAFPDSAAALASQFPAVSRLSVVGRCSAVAAVDLRAVFLPADDKAVCFPVEAVAIRPAAAWAAAVAGNTAGDSQVEIPDSNRPTSTDSRNTSRLRNKPFRQPNSFASRSSPTRSWDRKSSRPPQCPRQTKSWTSPRSRPRYSPASPPALRK
jgi:hypothetical protein